MFDAVADADDDDRYQKSPGATQQSPLNNRAKCDGRLDSTAIDGVRAGYDVLS